MTARRLPLVHIPARTRVYPLGTPLPARAPPLLTFERELDVPHHGPRGFAVVGDGEGRTRFVQTLLSKHLFDPLVPPPGAFPYIQHLLSAHHSRAAEGSTSPLELPAAVRHLQFARPSPTGEFTDFTARYGSLQEEDRVRLITWLRSLLPSAGISSVPLEDQERTADSPHAGDAVIRASAAALGITHLLELPLVALSSGQTRRARIAAGLLTRPRLLLLEDPFAGLDVRSRGDIGTILGEINAGRSALDANDTRIWDGAMRIMLILRGQGAMGMPEWVTDVVDVREGLAWTGGREEWADWPQKRYKSVQPHAKASVEVDNTPKRDEPAGPPVVNMNGVSVTYGSKKVLDNVSWSIRPNSRWHLQGSNGSGKTTLLSLLLGHHPRSFSLPEEALQIFEQPRRRIATPTLRKMIGHASPEIFAAFPRGMGLSAGEAIATGYEGVFSRRRVGAEQQERILGLLSRFQDLLEPAVNRRTRDATTSTSRAIYNTDFAQYTPNLQALLLFLRAIVARPRLLVLDEASQGMDEATWARCKELLENEWSEIAAASDDQAVVCVSHWEEEVPWAVADGDVLRLHDGVVEVDTSLRI